MYERAKGNHPEIEFAGILWHQGESDASKPETAATYSTRFLKAMAGFRDRFQATEAPVIAGETCRFPEGSMNPYYLGRPQVTAQTRQAIVALKHAAFVTSEGLVCDEEYTHFNTVSIRKFGLRYARAYLGMVQG